MKVLITSDWYVPAVNGVVTSVLNLRRELERQGHTVRVLTLANSRQSFSADGVTYLGSLSAGLLYPGARVRAALGRAEVQELIDWAPDVVHSQCEFSTFFLAKKIARAAHAPLIHTYHTVYEDYTHYFSPVDRWGRGLAAGFSRWILGQTDSVVVPTQKVKELLLGYGVSRPIHVIPTGIDLSRFAQQPAPEKVAARRAELGIPEKNRVVVYVGRLAKEKNVAELLACRAGLAEDVTLLVAGDGPERGALEAQAKAMGLEKGVVFAGMIPPEQVAEYYHLGDVFVSASTSETQGLTYLEALACGLPAICRADACLSGVIENEKNGWQYHTLTELEQDVNTLLGDETLRRSMAKKSLEIAQAHSAPIFAQTAARLYGAEVWRMGGDAEPEAGELLWQGI